MTQFIAGRIIYHKKQISSLKLSISTKRISLKIGTRNSVHVDPISKFVGFLKQNSIQGKTIHEYLKYHYADGITNGRGSTRQSVEEYKRTHQLEIDRINQEINKEEIIIGAVNIFIIYGDNCSEPIDVLSTWYNCYFCVD